MRIVGSSVLTLEALVVLLAIPVALVLGTGHSNAAVIAAFVIIVVLCLVTVGMITRPHAIALGWVTQALVIASGFLVPAMFLLGVLFALLWFWAVRIGTRADEAKARAAAGPAEPR
jgi:hypothetical protein